MVEDHVMCRLPFVLALLVASTLLVPMMLCYGEGSVLLLISVKINVYFIFMWR